MIFNSFKKISQKHSKSNFKMEDCQDGKKIKIFMIKLKCNTVNNVKNYSSQIKLMSVIC
jgi:hypothetical protein